MDIKETEDRLAHITDTIEKIGAVIESDILKLADWIKRKYQLEDALKAARQNKGIAEQTPHNTTQAEICGCEYCGDTGYLSDEGKPVQAGEHSPGWKYCPYCSRKLSAVR